MFKFRSIDRKNRVEHISSTSKKTNGIKLKIIGCRVTEDELQNIITPTMHDCFNLGLIKHGTVSSFVRFCINFWIAHYRTKKQEFEMRRQDIEQEKKLAAIAAEKEAYQKSTRHVIQKAAKGIEELEEELDRGFENTHPSPPQQQHPRPQATTSRTANLSLEDMMA